MTNADLEVDLLVLAAGRGVFETLGVLDELGPMPAPNEPTALAFWGAALVNPLPPMGIALEIRGKMLEAKSIDERLIHLERTVTRSIANLNGTNPL